MNKQQLLEEYAFKKMLYSLSLKERIMSKLGWLRVDSQVPEEYNKLNTSEIKKLLQTIDKPWWDKGIERILPVIQNFKS